MVINESMVISEMLLMQIGYKIKAKPLGDKEITLQDIINQTESLLDVWKTVSRIPIPRYSEYLLGKMEQMVELASQARECGLTPKEIWNKAMQAKVNLISAGFLQDISKYSGGLLKQLYYDEVFENLTPLGPLGNNTSLNITDDDMTTSSDILPLPDGDHDEPGSSLF